MKYWLYLAAKLAGAFAATWYLFVAAVTFLPRPPKPTYGREPLFLHDALTTFAVLFVWLLGVGLVYLAVYDQRRRCPTCLRRLIMPVSTGSWSNMLTFGRPGTEWICPFGHGTLRMEDLQITGAQRPDWKSNSENIWEELESYEDLKK